jgi:hypothetical protein
MVHIPEGIHPVIGSVVGVAGNAASTFDWVNCKHAQKLYCIVNIKRATATKDYMVAYSASDSAGTGSSEITSGINFWTQTATFDRLVAKTSSNSSTVTASATGALMIVAALNPEALPSSHPWVAFALRSSSQVGNLHFAQYLISPRFGGYQSFLATTSST